MYEVVRNSPVLGVPKAVCWDIKKTGTPTLQEMLVAANQEFYSYSYPEIEVSVSSDDGSPILVLTPKETIRKYRGAK